MKAWLSIACSRPVVTRGLKYAVIVSGILIAINHGDAILNQEITGEQLAKMILTLFVPYLVSTSSSVSAIREIERKN